MPTLNIPVSMKTGMNFNHTGVLDTISESSFYFKYIFNINDNNTYPRITHLMFDTSVIPNNVNINSAILELSISNPTLNTFFEIHVRQLLNAEIYNYATLIGGTLIDTQSVGGSANLVSFSIKSAIDNWVSGAENDGISVYDNSVVDFVDGVDVPPTFGTINLVVDYSPIVNTYSNSSIAIASCNTLPVSTQITSKSVSMFNNKNVQNILRAISKVNHILNEEIKLHFNSTLQPCPDCDYDPILRESTNPFCPTCGGDGWIETESSITIPASVEEEEGLDDMEITKAGLWDERIIYATIDIQEAKTINIEQIVKIEWQGTEYEIKKVTPSFLQGNLYEYVLKLSRL